MKYVGNYVTLVPYMSSNKGLIVSRMYFVFCIACITKAQDLSIQSCINILNIVIHVSMHRGVIKTLVVHSQSIFGTGHLSLLYTYNDNTLTYVVIYYKQY